MVSTSASASALEFFVHHVLLQGLLNVETTLRSASAILKGETAGVKVEITCSGEHTSGWIHNGSNGSGVSLGLGLGKVHFLQCVVSEPESEHCQIANELLLASALIALGSIAAETYALFSPDPTGVPFTKFTFEGCKQSALNVTFNVTGEVAGLVEDRTSSLDFKEGAPNNKLRFAGNPATILGEGLILMEGGGAIEVL
jgi:hypothetical protein